MNDKKMCDCNQGSFPCSCKGEAMEAQPSGVVLPERKTALNGDVLSFQSEGWNACLDEFARLNGAGSHE